MAKSYYAWSELRAGTAEKPVVIPRGAKVSASDLGISAEEFKATVDSGAIRNKPFPTAADYAGSAVDFLREQLAEATSSTVEEAAAEADVAALAGES